MNTKIALAAIVLGLSLAACNKQEAPAESAAPAPAETAPAAAPAETPPAAAPAEGTPAPAESTPAPAPAEQPK